MELIFLYSAARKQMIIGSVYFASIVRDMIKSCKNEFFLRAMVRFLKAGCLAIQLEPKHEIRKYRPQNWAFGRVRYDTSISTWNRFCCIQLKTMNAAIGTNS
jgi:hypothetical protein